MNQAIGWQSKGKFYAGLGGGGGKALYTCQFYDIIPSVEPICSTSNLTLTNAPAGYSLTWSSPNSNLTVSSSGIATRLNSLSDTVSVTATIGGCPTSINIKRKLIVGTGIKDPLFEQKTVFCYDPQHYSILGRVSLAPGNATYKWYIGTSTGTNYVLETTSTGNSATVPGSVVDNLYHTLKVDITNECNTIVSTARVDGRFKASCTGGGGGGNLMAFPNPASSKLTAQLVSDTAELSSQSMSALSENNTTLKSESSAIVKQQFVINLYDSFGVLKSNAKSESGELAIDVSHLPNGIYTLRMESDDGIVTKQVVIKH